MGAKIGAIEGFFSVILFVFNVLLAVAGILLIVIGALVLNEFHEYTKDGVEFFSERNLVGISAITMVVGILLLLIGIFGIGGLCCKKKWMIITYIVLLLILIVLEITAAALAFTNSDKIKEGAQTGIRAGVLIAYGSNPNNTTRKALDKLQEKFDCCGGFNYTDYGSQSLPVPESCCVKTGSGCSRFPPVNIYIKGCADATFDKLKDRSTAITAFCISFLVIQVIAVIFAGYMLKRDDEQYV